MKYVPIALALIASASTAFTPVSGECVGLQPPDEVTELNFAEATVATNELHINGSELRYSNIGKYENIDLDLRVTVNGGDYTNIADGWASNKPPKIPEKQNGKSKSKNFGKINLWTVRDKPKSGEGNFRFCLVKKGTNEVIMPEHFVFTVLDLDERGSNQNTLKERMFIDVDQAELYQVDENTEIIISCEDGTSAPCSQGVRTQFHSSTVGVGKDNPSDPASLTPLQMKRSVAFTFKDTGCWEFTFDHYCPVDQPGYNGPGKKCRWYGGGNLLFSGLVPQISDDGKCVTKAPTPSPTNAPTTEPTIQPTDPPPTFNPTAAPTAASTSAPTAAAPTASSTPAPTAASTHAPTAASPTLSPPTCSEDAVELIRMTGVTEIDLENAIRIIDQDTTTVTVRLSQAWTSSSDGQHIDHIFYRYQHGPFQTDCYQQNGVAGQSPIEDIVLFCYVSKPFAVLEICVADDSGGVLDPTGDNATIPKCCHEDFPSTVPVVCYKIAIECESQCVQ